MKAKRILVVEDDPDTRRFYNIVLQSKGYETFFAKDPLSCLWEAHKNRPDLILLDIGLAAGDGFRAMEQLKTAAHLANIPIVVVSGRRPQECEARALQSGARAYLQKPMDQTHLLQLVAELVGPGPGEVNVDCANARHLAETDI
jgi:CheY-like chemotaxis protein